MLHGLLGAFKAMLWSAVLLFLILTLFGIVAVEVINPLVREIDAEGGFPGCERCHRSFATVWDSMVTFFQQVVAGDSWGLITIPVMEKYPLTWPFFILVVVTIQFGILNLILVAIVDQAHKASNDDALFQAATRNQEYEKCRHELLGLCGTLDSDKSGQIELKELMVGYETMPELANQLRFLEIKKEDMQILFATLDSDSSGSVDYEEFVAQLFNMQNQDPGVLLTFLRSYIQDVRKHIFRQSDDIRAQATEIAELKQMMHDFIDSSTDRLALSTFQVPKLQQQPQSSLDGLEGLLEHHLRAAKILQEQLCIDKPGQPEDIPGFGATQDQLDLQVQDPPPATSGVSLRATGADRSGQAVVWQSNETCSTCPSRSGSKEELASGSDTSARSQQCVLQSCAEGRHIIGSSGACSSIVKEEISSV